jgi:chromosome segregation ATPase
MHTYHHHKQYANELPRAGSSAEHAAVAMALTAEVSELKASLDSYRATCQGLQAESEALRQRCSDLEEQLVQQAMLKVEHSSHDADMLQPQPRAPSAASGALAAGNSVSAAEHAAVLEIVQALQSERSALQSKLDEVCASLAAERAHSQGLTAQVDVFKSR